MRSSLTPGEGARRPENWCGATEEKKRGCLNPSSPTFVRRIAVPRPSSPEVLEEVVLDQGLKWVFSKRIQSRDIQIDDGQLLDHLIIKTVLNEVQDLRRYLVGRVENQCVAWSVLDDV